MYIVNIVYINKDGNMKNLILRWIVFCFKVGIGYLKFSGNRDL